MADKSRRVEDEILTLIIEHEPLLRHIIGLGVDNPTDRDGVYQETVVAVLEGFRKGAPVEHPKAWMAQIAKNKCIDFQRGREICKKDKQRLKLAIPIFLRYAPF